MVNVAQLVRALDCGSKGRGFESHLSPPPFLGRGGLIFVTAFFYICFCLFSSDLLRWLSPAEIMQVLSGEYSSTFRIKL